jgi:hypothetical protein
MKTLILLPIMALLCVISACKKESQQSVGFQIEVSGLPSGNSLNLHVTNNIGVIYDNTVSDNGTYTTGAVSPNQQVLIKYTLTNPVTTSVLLKFFYKGESMGSVGFINSNSIAESVPQP